MVDEIGKWSRAPMVDDEDITSSDMIMATLFIDEPRCIFSTKDLRVITKTLTKYTPTSSHHFWYRRQENNLCTFWIHIRAF